MADYIKIDIDKRLFECIFEKEDYKEFLQIISNKEEEIESVSIAPINNFDHNITNLINRNVLIYLYRHIKYYLEQKNLYPSKMQEGLALCASKALIIDTFFPNVIDSYISVGDKAGSGSKTNPFEEIFRMLLIATKNERYSNNFGNVTSEQKNKGALGYESNLFLDVVKKALNKKCFDKIISKFSKEENIVDIIGEEIDQSNVDSSRPISVSLKENKSILMLPFDRIYGLYDDKVNCRILIGDLPSNSSANILLTRFLNKITYAKKNIGVYQKTKTLSKENSNN